MTGRPSAPSRLSAGLVARISSAIRCVVPGGEVDSRMISSPPVSFGAMDRAADST
jgi:hypothetical protein